MQQEDDLINAQPVSFSRNSVFVIEVIFYFPLKLTELWKSDHAYLYCREITSILTSTQPHACFGGWGKMIRLRPHFTHEQNIWLQAPSAMRSSQAFAIQSRPTTSDLTQLTFLVSWTTVSLFKLATSSSRWQGLLRNCKWSGVVG